MRKYIVETSKEKKIFHIIDSSISRLGCQNKNIKNSSSQPLLQKNKTKKNLMINFLGASI